MSDDRLTQALARLRGAGYEGAPFDRRGRGVLTLRFADAERILRDALAPEESAPAPVVSLTISNEQAADYFDKLAAWEAKYPKHEWPRRGAIFQAAAEDCRADKSFGDFDAGTLVTFVADAAARLLVAPAPVEPKDSDEPSDYKPTPVAAPPAGDERERDLEALRKQAEGSHSLAAQQAYINGLEYALDDTRDLLAIETQRLHNCEQALDAARAERDTERARGDHWLAEFGLVGAECARLREELEAARDGTALGDALTDLTRLRESQGRLRKGVERAKQIFREIAEECLTVQTMEIAAEMEREMDDALKDAAAESAPTETTPKEDTP